MERMRAEGGRERIRADGEMAIYTYKRGWRDDGRGGAVSRLAERRGRWRQANVRERWRDGERGMRAAVDNEIEGEMDGGGGGARWRWDCWKEIDELDKG